MKKFIVSVLAFVLAVGGALLLGGEPDQQTKVLRPDGELLYKTHCTRCHSTPPGLSERQTRVIVRHMRVRANLLSNDYDAVLAYLAQNTRVKN